jgi:hypothetical protein
MRSIYSTVTRVTRISYIVMTLSACTEPNPADSIYNCQRQAVTQCDCKHHQNRPEGQAMFDKPWYTTSTAFAICSRSELRIEA